MIKAILFDFDGVLVDSKDSTITYFQETFRRLNLPVPTRDEITPLLGLKTIVILNKLLPTYTAEQIKPVFDLNSKLSVEYVSQVKLIDGTHIVLSRLKKLYKLGLVTNRGKTTAKLLFKKHALGKYFSVVLDREDVLESKPHPEGLLKALVELKTKREDAVYIGDTSVDSQAATNGGLQSIIINRTDIGDYQVKRLLDLPKKIAEIEKSIKT